jgi:hypothetical protein
MKINTKIIKKYLLMMCCFLSLMGIILMIIGYSKIGVKLEVTDVFNPETGVNYSLEKIMESITRNFSTQESHYFIVFSGLSMGLCFASNLSIIVMNIFIEIEKEEKDNIVYDNPMMRGVP